MWWWALLVLAADILIGVSLIRLLLQRDYSDAGSVEWVLAPRRRRAWNARVALLATAYLCLAPVSYAGLVQIIRPRAPKKRSATAQPTRPVGFERLPGAGITGRDGTSRSQPDLRRAS